MSDTLMLQGQDCGAMARQASMQIFRAVNGRVLPDSDGDSGMELLPMSEATQNGFARLIDAGMGDGSVAKDLFDAPGFFLSYNWFKPHFPLPRHSHRHDCLYYIVSGGIRLGTATGRRWFHHLRRRRSDAYGEGNRQENRLDDQGEEMVVRLINAPPSPFGRKVAIALHEKNIPFETIWEQPWNEATIVGDYNPLAQLPILIADDGEVGYESNYLLEWIERRFPEPPLLPADDNGILKAKQLMLLADAIMESSSMIIRELSRPPSNEAWVTRFRQKITRATETLSDAVAGHEFAIRERFSQADISIVVNLKMLDTLTDWFETKIEIDSWRARLPDLVAYVTRIDERPAFVATRPQRMAHDAPVYSEEASFKRGYQA